MKRLTQTTVFILGFLCSSNADANQSYPWLAQESTSTTDSLRDRIPAPDGYSRVTVKKSSFAAWLRRLPLMHAQSPVRAYDGRILNSPAAAVVDLDVGKRDLQQCADSIIRLRAEYLFSQGRHEDISFQLTNGMNVDFSQFTKGYQLKQVSRTKVKWVPRGKRGASHGALQQYLKQVYLWAGTASLQNESIRVRLTDLQAGDFFIQGGFPGHTVLILDIAENAKGETRALIGQGFMPAQSFHVVPNREGNPWHALKGKDMELWIPGWPKPFRESDLYRFSPHETPHSR